MDYVLMACGQDEAGAVPINWVCVRVFVGVGPAEVQLKNGLYIYIFIAPKVWREITAFC